VRGIYIIWQAIKFGIAGIINTTIGLLIYYIFIFVDRDLYIWGNIFGFFVSTFSAYYLNSRFVFQENRSFDIQQEKNRYNVKLRILKTYLSYGFSLVLSTILLYLWVRGFYVSESVAPIINLFITIPLNFCLNKCWVYRKGGIDKK